MRKPFELKNTIEEENRGIAGDPLGLDFEESFPGGTSLEDRLEREGGSAKKIGILKFLLIAVLGLIFFRLYYLAVGKHDYFREIAEGNRLRIEYLSAPRGAIYDASGRVLAANKPSFELVANPLDIPKDEVELEKIIGEVSRIFQIPPEDIKGSILREELKIYESVLIKQNVSREQALIFHERAGDLRGFRVLNVPIRDYKDGPVYAHLLGYVGKIDAKEYERLSSEGYLFNDFSGKAGLEAIYENYLRGQFGQRQVEVDARGVVKKVYGEKPPLAGRNLYLTVDAGLQEKLTDTLLARLRGLNRKRAAAIAINPQNGKVLAYISFPSYDNNLFAEGISSEQYQKLASDQDQPLFNRAIQGVYPPGSTVKPMVAAAALQERVVTPRTLIEDQGYLVIRNIYGGPDYYFYGYGRRALGTMDVRRALALSSDIFFYIVGGGYETAKIEGLGIDRLASYFRKFNLGQILGIDLPGEETGLVPTPEWKEEYFGSDPVASRWYLGDTYHVSIGQGDLLVTPLQVASWVATVANGGKVFKPYFLDRVVDNEGQIVTQFEPRVISELGIDPNFLDIVRQGMRQAVTEGTAKSLNSLPVAVAGKTGTAQFDARNPYRTHAWFMAFAPYENPEIAIVVLIEDGGEGGVNSVPVVREVLDWWAKNRYNQNQ